MYSIISFSLTLEFVCQQLKIFPDVSKQSMEEENFKSLLEQLLLPFRHKKIHTKQEVLELCTTRWERGALDQDKIADAVHPFARIGDEVELALRLQKVNWREKVSDCNNIPTEHVAIYIFMLECIVS